MQRNYTVIIDKDPLVDDVRWYYETDWSYTVPLLDLCQNIQKKLLSWDERAKKSTPHYYK